MLCLVIQTRCFLRCFCKKLPPDGLEGERAARPALSMPTPGLADGGAAPTGGKVGHVDALLQAGVCQVQGADHVGPDGLNLRV